jgi:hypothetical protein
MILSFRGEDAGVSGLTVALPERSPVTPAEVARSVCTSDRDVCRSRSTLARIHRLLGRAARLRAANGDLAD